MFVTGEKCLKITFNSDIAVLQSHPGCRQTLQTLENICVQYTSLQKSHHNHFNMFINKKEKNDVKMIIPFCIANHITISLQITAIRYF